MKRFDRLIFVSNSDTYMGPMAKGIMRSKYLLSDLDVDSRGLVVLFPEPANPKAEAVMEMHEQSLKDHAAEALQESDFDERTLILAVNEESQRKIFENYENAQNVFSAFKLCEQYGRDQRSLWRFSGRLWSLL